MYLERITQKRKEKTYTQILLRESYREPGAPRSRVKHRTLLNLTHRQPQEIAAIEFALKNKHRLAELETATPEKYSRKQGKSAGAVWLLHQLAGRLGLAKALGSRPEGRLALWQVIARLIDQGSRLSAVRLAGEHVAAEVLELPGFDEDDLYANLAWLADNQEKIEKRLFKLRRSDSPPNLFLYDVTSSYLEGDCNELGAYGYNRDGKRGKKQIVIGLLCDDAGAPMSVEVFAGNTNDIATFGAQVQKAAERFGCERITFVGDRGMIKSGGIEELSAAGFHYITAITKLQIESLIKAGAFQLDLFDVRVCEVERDGVRYVLRRNPARAAEIAASRADRRACIERELARWNEYLAAHNRARTATAEKALMKKIDKLRIAAWLSVEVGERELELKVDEAALETAARLDGCYVIKTDLPVEAASAQAVHDRYKDLALVERAFRMQKTGHLELRPIYVRKESSTRGHALVVMLAYMMRRELERDWRDLDLTVEEGIAMLSSLCTDEVRIGEGAAFCEAASPRDSVAELFAACEITPPGIFTSRPARVATKRKLPSRRKPL